MSQPTVIAAGGVLWRGDPDHPEVALVHRPKYDDWSLPKGKAESGEHVLITALREVTEETGFRAHLGPYLNTVRYRVAAGRGPADKSVSYWSMKCAAGHFRASSEVDEMQWLPVTDASELVDAESDRLVLEVFEQARRDTHLLVLVRHGETAKPPRRSLERPEDQPLNSAGRGQAEALARVVEMLGVTDLMSADQPASCSMLTPAAGATGLGVHLELQLTRAGFEGHEDLVVERVRRAAQVSEALVVCAGKRVISSLLHALGESPGVAPPDSGTVRRGDLWLLHHRDGALIAFEKHELASSAPPVLTSDG